MVAGNWPGTWVSGSPDQVSLPLGRHGPGHGGRAWNLATTCLHALILGCLSTYAALPKNPEDMENPPRIHSILHGPVLAGSRGPKLVTPEATCPWHLGCCFAFQGGMHMLGSEASEW